LPLSWMIGSVGLRFDPPSQRYCGMRLLVR
jgi:hypothetical protein